MTDYYRVTVNFPPDEEAWFDERMENSDYNSRSELVVDLFERGREHDQELAECRERVDELQERIAEKEERIDELEEQMAKRSQIEDKIEDLPKKIKDEQTYRERRQRVLDQASFTQRLKWKVTGVPVDEAQESGTDR